MCLTRVLLVAQLMQHVTSPPPLTCDATRLSDEFPRWLEKVSSKLPGGVVIVLDSIHSVQVRALLRGNEPRGAERVLKVRHSSRPVPVTSNRLA